jgi:hypothetical protein
MVQDAEEGREVALAGIREAEDRLNTKLWRWNITTQSITLTGATTYSLLATFKAPRSAQLLDSGSIVRGVINFLDPKTFDLSYTDRSGGSLEAYTAYNDRDDGLITLNSTEIPYPTLKLVFYRRIQTMTDAAATPLAVPREVESFVYWAGAMYVAAIYDTAKVALAERTAEMRWDRLISDDLRSQLSDFA